MNDKEIKKIIELVKKHILKREVCMVRTKQIIGIYNKKSEEFEETGEAELQAWTSYENLPYYHCTLCDDTNVGDPFKHMKEEHLKD